MRTKRLPLLLLMGLVIAACGDGNGLTADGRSGAAVAGSDSSSFYGPLRQSGRWFVDGQGRVVVLHGVNDTHPQRSQEEPPASFDHDDAAFLVREGFNTVRLAIFMSGVMPAPNEFDTAYIDSVADKVRIMTDAGLYVVVDFHQDLYTNKYYGRGMPEWMAVDNGIPNAPNQNNLFLNYALNPAVQHAFDNFWLNQPGPDGTPLQEHYAAGLQEVVKRFIDVPGVLGFDIMNEPFPGTQFTTCASPLGCPLFDQFLLTPFSQRMADAIREIAPHKVVFYEPNVTFDFGANTHHGDVGDNAALSFHIYCLGEQFGDQPVDQGDLCETLGERPQFGYARDHAEQFTVSTMLSEFGHFTAGPETDISPTLARMARLADEFMFNWQYWHYARAAGVSERGSENLVADLSKPPTDDNVFLNKLEVLARAYPRAIAGTPLSWSFDPESKQFMLEYTTQPVDPQQPLADDAVTEIFLSGRHYPDGFDVTVENGTAVESGNPRLLHVQAMPGEEQVRVSISVQ